MAIRKETRIVRKRKDEQTGATIQEIVEDDGLPEVPPEPPRGSASPPPWSLPRTPNIPHPGRGFRFKPGPLADAWIWERRRSGRSLAWIASELGRGVRYVQDACTRAARESAAAHGMYGLNSPHERKEAARALELDRLDRAQLKLDHILEWSPEDSGGTVPPTHKEVIAAATAQVRVSDARSRLLDLKAPERLSVEYGALPDGGTHVSRLASLVAQLPPADFEALVRLDQLLQEAERRSLLLAARSRGPDPIEETADPTPPRVSA